MRLASAVGTVGLVSCAASPFTAAQGPTAEHNPNRIAIYLGQRSLDENDYEPVEDQATFGLEFSQEHRNSVVGWEIGLMGTRHGCRLRPARDLRRLRVLSGRELTDPTAARDGLSTPPGPTGPTELPPVGATLY